MRRVKSDLIQTFKVIKVWIKLIRVCFSNITVVAARRGHSDKLFKKCSRLDTRKYAFSKLIELSTNGILYLKIV